MQPAESETLIRQNWNNGWKEDLTSPKNAGIWSTINDQGSNPGLAVHNIAVKLPIVDTRISHPRHVPPNPMGAGNCIKLTLLYSLQIRYTQK